MTLSVRAQLMRDSGDEVRLQAIEIAQLRVRIVQRFVDALEVFEGTADASDVHATRHELPVAAVNDHVEGARQMREHAIDLRLGRGRHALDELFDLRRVELGLKALEARGLAVFRSDTGRR